MKKVFGNLKIYSGEKKFLKLLNDYKIIEEGRFEYKKIGPDGRRTQGEWYINFRRLSTAQELQLAPLYLKAIEEFFGKSLKGIIIVGVASASISLPKVVQLLMYKKYKTEFAYTEKREGKLYFDKSQSERLKGKHVFFIEDVANNGASLSELNSLMRKNKFGHTKYSILYGVHRGHTFLQTPRNGIFAMSLIYAPSYSEKDLPTEIKKRKLKRYKS
jgi:orotate phosphoribosyltransferase